jgi:hypothetical protein
VDRCPFCLPNYPDIEVLMAEHFLETHAVFRQFPILAWPSDEKDSKRYNKFGGVFFGTDLDDWSLETEQLRARTSSPSNHTYDSGAVAFCKLLGVTFVSGSKSPVYSCVQCYHVEKDRQEMKRHLIFSHTTFAAPPGGDKFFSPRRVQDATDRVRN